MSHQRTLSNMGFGAQKNANKRSNSASKEELNKKEEGKKLKSSEDDSGGDTEEDDQLKQKVWINNFNFNFTFTFNLFSYIFFVAFPVVVGFANFSVIRLEPS